MTHVEAQVGVPVGVRVGVQVGVRDGARDGVQVGVLSFAHYHANFWSEVFAERGVLAGIWDDDPARGNEAATRFGVPYFDDLDALLERCTAVAICSETIRHRELIERAAARGLAVLCEKPLGVSLDDCEEIARVVRSSGIAFMQSFPKRFDPVSHFLRDTVASAELGTITLVRIRHGHFYGLQDDFRDRWYVDPAKSGGGALLDEGVHGADLLAWLFGMPESVTAVVSSAALRLDVEDLGVATFAYADGMVAELTSSFAFAAADVSVELYGTKGTVLVSGVDLASKDITAGGFVRRYRTADPERKWETIALTPRFKQGAFHHQNALAFVAALEKNEAPPITVDDGVRAVRMIMAAYRAAATGQRQSLENRGQANRGQARNSNSSLAPISLLMIGCGGFARRYHVPAILADPAVTIAGIFDPHPVAEVHALAERYRAPVTNSIAGLPQPAGLACALVTTPHMLHASHVDAVLDRALHVLVDKPFVMTAAEAKRLAQRAAALGVVNGVAYNRRFDPGCLRARQIIRDGGIGQIRFVQTVQLGYERSGWFLVPELGGGGPYTGRATHMADIVPWLIGRQPTRLRSRLRTTSPARSDHGGFIELLCGDLEWQATCIEEGWHMWDEIRIFGDDGLIELRRPLTAPIGWELTWLSQRGEKRENVPADPHPGDATRDFLSALRTGGRPACTFAEAIPSVTIVELAFASARDGGRWLDIPPDISSDPQPTKEDA